MAVKGTFVDLSVYQPDTPAFFASLKSKGYRGVVVKLTEGSADGTNYVNPKAKTQIANAKAYGLNVSLYHFGQYTGVNDAKNEAAFFIANAKKYNLDNPVMVIDAESDAVRNNGATHATTKAFIDAVKNAGYKNTAVYSMQSWFTSGFLNPQGFGSHLIWVAAYGASGPGIDNADAWQWDDGQSPAGYRNVDSNYDFNGAFIGRTDNISPAKPTVTKKEPDVTFKHAGYTWHKHRVDYQLNEATNLRSQASVKGPLLATLKPGDCIETDAWSYHDGYCWVRQPRMGGHYAYLTTGQYDDDGHRKSLWGKWLKA